MHVPYITVPSRMRGASPKPRLGNDEGSGRPGTPRNLRLHIHAPYLPYFYFQLCY